MPYSTFSVRGPLALPSGLDAATTAWVAAVVAAGGTVSDTQQTRVNTLINALKTAGIFSAWDAFWLLDADNTQQTQIDIVNLKSWTVIGGSAVLGSAGTAMTGALPAIDTTVNLSTATKYQQTNACLMSYVSVVGASSEHIMGATNGSIWGIMSVGGAGNEGAGINIVNGDTAVNPGNAAGLRIGRRVAAGIGNDSYTAFNAAHPTGQTSAASGDTDGARPNFNAYMFTSNAIGGIGSSPFTGTLAAAGIGSAPSGANMSALSDALNGIAGTFNTGYLGSRGHAIY